jgi:hypothetical protein
MCRQLLQEMQAVVQYAVAQSCKSMLGCSLHFLQQPSAQAVHVQQHYELRPAFAAATLCT